MIAVQIDAMLITKFIHQTIYQELIEIVSSQTIIAVACEHLGNIFFDGDNRNVEGAAAKVVNHNRSIFIRSVSVSEAGCRRFIEYPHNFQTRELTGFTRCVALSI